MEPQCRPETTPEAPYERPAIEVVSLSCEISAYAPDGDAPLV